MTYDTQWRDLRRTTLCLAVTSLVLATGAGAQARQFPFSDPGWEFRGDDTKIDTVMGQPAVRIRSGHAIRRDVVFQDGTIEFDMAVTPYRAFVYLQFRMASDENYEDLYFRSHKSGLPDAIQYSPVYAGASNWQLYHGEGHTAAAEFPAYQWIHVKVVVSGTRAAVFVDNPGEPQMVIPRLAREPQAGYVALRGFLPGGNPPGVYPASFANVTIRPGEVDFDFSTVPVTEESPRGVVRNWRVSPPFSPAPGMIRELPPSLVASDAWRTLTADLSGLLVLGRHVVVPQGSRRPAVLARVMIDATRATTKQLNFGFSDEVSVFLNGRLLYYGNDGYSFNYPRRQGLIGLHQGTLFLPLREGQNELVLAVAEVFGGWGVMGQFPDVEGIEVTAR
jgi:hypothetical protein